MEAETASRKSNNTSTPSKAHHQNIPGAVTLTQGAVPSTSTCTVTSMPSAVPGNSLSSSNSEFESESVSVNLTTCSNVSFEARDGHSGVRYTSNSDEIPGWTPVIGRRRKRPQLPPFCVTVRRFPPDHPIHQHHASHSDDDTSSEEDEELIITTMNTSKWTPIVTRTRSKCKQSTASVK